MSILVADLPVPGTVVIDLPENTRMYFCIFQISHGKVFLGRPVSGVGNMEVVGGALNGGLLDQFHAKFRESIDFPVQFPLPAVVRDPDLQLFISGKAAFFFNSFIMEVGDILQSLCFRAVICHGMPGADHGKSIIKLPEGVGGDTGFFILRVEGDKPAVFVPFIGMRKIFHPVTGSSDDVFVAMTLIGAVKAGEIYTEEGEAFRNGLSDEVLPL